MAGYRCSIPLWHPTPMPDVDAGEKRRANAQRAFKIQSNHTRAKTRGYHSWLESGNAMVINANLKNRSKFAWRCALYGNRRMTPHQSEFKSVVRVDVLLLNHNQLSKHTTMYTHKDR